KPRALFQVNGTGNITGAVNINGDITNQGLTTNAANGNIGTGFSAASASIGLNMGTQTTSNIATAFTSGTNSTSYVVNNFTVNATQTTAAGGYTVVTANIGTNVDGSSTQTTALLRGFNSQISTKSNSTTPITQAVNYEATGLSVINARTQTFTTAYQFKSDGMTTASIITAGGNFYSFFADSSLAANYTGASAWGFYQRKNTA